MGTRSLIAVVHGNNYKTVYCHWDGYLSHNGRILQEYYDSPKANNLVALGNMSSLASNIDETAFYGRDREEEGQEFVTHTSKESLIEHFNHGWCEYAYIMKDGTWYVMYQGDPEFYLLSEELAKDKEVQE